MAEAETLMRALAQFRKPQRIWPARLRPRTALRSFLETVMDITYANRVICCWSETANYPSSSEGTLNRRLPNLPNRCELNKPSTIQAYVRFVYRTLTPVIIDEDHRHIRQDRYIRKTRPKSVACAPILTQGVPIGVLCLRTLWWRHLHAERLEVVYLWPTDLPLLRSR